MLKRKNLVVAGVAFTAGCLITGGLLSKFDSKRSGADVVANVDKANDFLLSHGNSPSNLSNSPPSLSSQLPDAPPGYRKVVENLSRSVDVMINKPEKVNRQKVVHYTVNRPIRESHQKIVKYLVAKNVTEMRSKAVTSVLDGVERTEFVHYTVQVPVTEEREKIVFYATVKIVPEVRSKTVNYAVTTTKQEKETRVKDYEVVRYEEI